MHILCSLSALTFHKTNVMKHLGQVILGYPSYKSETYGKKSITVSPTQAVIWEFAVEAVKHELGISEQRSLVAYVCPTFSSKWRLNALKMPQNRLLNLPYLLSDTLLDI